MVFCRVATAATRNEFRKAQNRLRSNHSNSICAFAEFCQRFTPGGKVLYVGDADEKWMVFDENAFRKLGITVANRPKRQAELKALFSSCKDRLVFVTAFLTRKDLTKFLGQISWETEVWVAESPDHLIHFNGERFLGPY